MTEMAETHVELNQFPVPRVGPHHSTLVPRSCSLIVFLYFFSLIRCRKNSFIISQNLIDSDAQSPLWRKGKGAVLIQSRRSAYLPFQATAPLSCVYTRYMYSRIQVSRTSNLYPDTSGYKWIQLASGLHVSGVNAALGGYTTEGRFPIPEFSARELGP